MGHAHLLVLAAVGAAVSGTAARAQESGPDEVRAVVAQMMSDAESRSSLLAGGDAGHDGSRFFIAGDGFKLTVSGIFQTRYDLNFRDEDSIASSADDFTHGFQLRRMKINFEGTLGKEWFFRARLVNRNSGTNASTSTADLIFDDAYAGYKFENGWKAQWGQFKMPFLREELISDIYQLAAERSLVNAVFTQGYSQGVQMSHEWEGWRLAVAFSDGINSLNTDFNARQTTTGIVKLGGQAEYAFTGRVDFLLGGAWKQFDDFTSPQGAEFATMIGAAAHWQQSDNTNAASDVDTQTFRYTVDASVEGSGWNLYGAFMGDHTIRRAAGTDTDLDNFGAVVQGGWRICEKTELFARWEGLFVDSDLITSGKKDFNFLTVGVNQYFAGHAMKATADAVYSFQDCANLLAKGVLPSTNTGLLGQAKSGEVVVRLQFQVVF